MVRSMMVLGAGMLWSLPAMADIAPGGCDCTTAGGSPGAWGVALVVLCVGYATMKRR